MQEALLGGSSGSASYPPAPVVGGSAWQKAQVSAWLDNRELGRYAAQLIAAGYDSMVFFTAMDGDELSQLVSDLKMPTPHARVFRGACAALQPSQPSSSLQQEVQPLGRSIQATTPQSPPPVVHAVPAQQPAPQPAPRPVAAVAPRRGATAAPRTAPTRQNRRWVDFDGGTLKCCSVIYLLVLIGGIVYLERS